MKYSILGFQQCKLIENKLTVEDAFILRVIKDMYSSSTMEFINENNVKYMWINYSYLLDQIPIIGSKRNLMRRIDKYSNELLIFRLLKHKRKGVKGNFSYIAPTEKLDKLQDFDLMTKSHKGYDKNGIRVMTKSHNKDTSIKDTSIKDNILIQIEELKINLVLKDKLIEFYNYRKEIKKPIKTTRPINSLLKNIGKEFKDQEHLIQCINKAMDNEWQGVKGEYVEYKKQETTGRVMTAELKAKLERAKNGD